MTFETEFAEKKADSAITSSNWANDFLQSAAKDNSVQKPELQRVAGLEDLFGSPVIDSRLAPQMALDPTIFQTGDKLGLDACEAHAKTTNQKDSLDSTKEGDSVLNRMYEVAVLTPKGTVKHADFGKTYGDAAAQKMQELGITQVNRSGSSISITLAKPLHFGDSSGSIDIGKSVTFTSLPQGGAVLLDNVNGVTASSGLFQLPINRVDLQPREHGHLSGLVTAGWTQTPVCATPDGKIHR